MTPADLLAALPPPRDDEPPSLRSDIVDELLDHLQCAFRREVLKDGDEAAAERRVLDRFGDPRKLARRLWWQAMWSRVMGKRILSGLQWLVSLAAVCLAAGVFWQQSQMLKEMANNQTAENHWRQNLSLTLNELRNRLPAPAAYTSNEPEAGGDTVGMFPMGMGGGARILEEPATPSLTVKLVQEKADGPPVTSMINEIVLTGAGQSFDGVPNAAKGMGGMGVGMPKVSTDGRFMFYDLDPDRYELKITLADGQHCTRPVLLRDDKPQELTIVCPGPRKKSPVIVTASIPDDLRDAGWIVGYDIEILPQTLAGTTWLAPSTEPVSIFFDAKTGDPNELRQGERIFSGPATELEFFLPNGPVSTRFWLYDVGPDKRGSYSFPQVDSKEPMIPRTVKPGENVWHLELPEELLAEARKQMKPQLSKFGTGDEEDSVSARKKDQPIGNLGVILTSETADGSPVTNAKVELLGNGKPVGQGPSLDKLGKPDYDEGLQTKIIKGSYLFTGLPADRYELRIELSDGQHCAQSVVVQQDKGRILTVVCPAPRQRVPVRISVPPLPEDLRKETYFVSVEIDDRPIMLDGTEWQTPGSRHQRVFFDPISGEVTGIWTHDSADPKSMKTVDLSQAKTEDRAVFLSTGEVTLRYVLDATQSTGVYRRVTWPPAGGFGERHQERQPPLSRTVEPDGNDWKLELPDELLELARQQLQKGPKSRMFRNAGIDPKTGNTIGVPVDAPKENQPAESEGSNDGGAADHAPAIQAEPLGDKCRLIVQLTGETNDGPPEKDVRIKLFNDVGQPLVQRRFDNGLSRYQPAAGNPGENIEHRPDDQGIARFDKLDPGRFSIEVTHSNGYRMQQQLPLLRPGQERTEHILCPSAAESGENAVLAITVSPVPVEVQKANCHFTVSLRKKNLHLGEVRWFNPSSEKLLLIDQPSGHPKARVNREGRVAENLDQVPTADRLIIVPTGDYEVSIQLYKSVPSSNLFGKLVAQQNIKAEYKVDAGDNSWKIEVPDEFWAEAKNKLPEVLTPSKPKTEDESPTPPSNPAVETPNANTDPPRKIDAPKLTLIAHSQGKPVAEVRVTLYRDDSQGKKVPALVETGVTNAAGQVQWTNLPAGRYRALIYASQVEMSTLLSLPWEGVGHEQRVIALPTDVRVTDTVVATNLPQDLIDAHVKVCLRLTSQQQKVGENSWFYSPDPFHLLVVGKEGVEGRIQLPKLGMAALETFRKLCHRIEPISELKLKLPVTPIRVASLDLICPAPATPKEADLKGKDIEWIVCAAPQPKRGTAPTLAPPEIAFEPKAGETNQWTIQVPDELIAIARSRIAEVKLEGELGGDTPAKQENTDEKPVEKSSDDEASQKNAAFDPDMGQLRVQVVRETDSRPVKDIEVALLERPGAREVRHQGVTDDHGTVTLNALNSDNYFLRVASRQTGFSAFQELTVRAGEQMTKHIKIPSNIASCRVKLTSNLPPDLADEGVRLCVMTRGIVDPGWLDPNRLEWNAGLGGATMVEPLVIGRDGCEGRLMGKDVWQSADFTPRTATTELLPVSQTAEGVVCPVVRHYLSSLALVRLCPSESTEDGLAATRRVSGAERVLERLDARSAAQSLRVAANREWEVLAAPKWIDGKWPECLDQRFTPVMDEENHWQINIPDELLVEARTRLTAAAQRPAEVSHR